MMVDTRSKNSDNGSIQCAPRNEAIVKPTTWEIKNGVGDLKDKHLLVFHLLPQTATRLIKKGNNVGKPAIGKKPSCKLFINFVIFSISKDSTNFYFSG
ncbi:unnamed protein product [Meloidogyne enterolobii]|uniref:Uncharacterized protein n=1 Tax=Meloidogyne enterolobii TaxID=390850 RepID=A0ACB0Z1T0_MELEN